MKRIRESYFRQQPFLGSIQATLERAGWIAALVILAALPSHAYSWYSGVSMGSDGTIYGWGVTDITSYTMVHQAYVATKLTSPKGRQASLSEGNGPNYYREDVQLCFDATDLGTYTETSTNQGWCFACMCWVVNTVTGAQASNAYPINFTQAGSEADGDGQLYFLYQWQSSSRNSADIASCQVGQFVTYPGYVAGQQNTYWWPSPPWQPYHNTNPVQTSVAGNNSYCTKNKLSGVAPCVIDNQQHSTFDNPPIKGDGFPASQNWWYQCPNVNGGNSVDLTTPTTIQRSVTNNGSTYTYQVTKSGASSFCVLGQTCAGP
jgi:hypothetical protein